MVGLFQIFLNLIKFLLIWSFKWGMCGRIIFALQRKLLEDSVYTDFSTNYRVAYVINGESE